MITRTLSIEISRCRDCTDCDCQESLVSFNGTWICKNKSHEIPKRICRENSNEEYIINKGFPDWCPRIKAQERSKK